MRDSCVEMLLYHTVPVQKSSTVECKTVLLLNESFPETSRLLNEP